MELHVYKISTLIEGKPEDLYTALMVDFESLQNQVEDGEEGFFVNTSTEEDLIKQVVKHLKKEIKIQLSGNILGSGKNNRKNSRSRRSGSSRI